MLRIQTFDTTAYLGVAAVLGLVALGACFVPVRRKIWMQPMAALRQD